MSSPSAEPQTADPAGFFVRVLRPVWVRLALFWIALAVVAATQLFLVSDFSWPTALVFNLLDWGPWILVAPAVLWFARRVQIDGHNWRRTLPLHVLGSIVAAVAVQSIALLAGELPLLRVSESDQARRPPPRADGRQPVAPRFIRARLSVPTYFVLVAAAHAIAYHRRSLERERRAQAAEARLAEARLMALQTQLNPHFLFNTLNAISSLVYTQPKEADEMICALSDLLRRALELADRREIPLEQEIEFAGRYLQIQRIRFSDRLQVRVEIAPAVARATVPTLILQPIVENAIVHGIAPRPTPGTLTLRAAANGDRLVVTVSDTGAGKAAAPSDAALNFKERVGLTNTRARLDALYAGNARLDLTPAPEGGVCVRLELPLRQTT